MDAINITPITTDRLERLEAETGKLYEVVNGVLKEKEMAKRRHGKVEGRIFFALMNHVMPRNLGEVYPADTSFVLKGTPDNIELMRLPDVAFVTAEREQHGDLDDLHYLAPDIAVEVISPSETRKEIEEKVNEYLEAGTRQVWLFYPLKKQIDVRFPDGTSKIYGENDTLTGGDVLPDFEVAVKTLFPD